MSAGTAKLTLADTTEITLPLANVRTQAFQYDRRMFRSPYGSIWHQEGDGRRLAQTVQVQAFVIDDEDGISDAASAADAIARFALTVEKIETDIGEFDVLALLSYAKSPIVSGYRLDLNFATLDGWQP